MTTKNQQNVLASMLASQVEDMRNGRPPSPFGFLQQLQQAAAVTSTKPARKTHNPRPPGKPQPGSATTAVLAELQRTGAALSEAQIRWVTGRSHSAVSWALLRLVGWGLVAKIADPNRHARYFRYRAVKTGGGDGQ
jgi:hypothetical protein